MRHLDEGTVERLGAGGTASTDEVRHLATCTACAAGGGRARAEIAEVGALLATLDPPVVSAEPATAALRAVLARAAAEPARPSRAARTGRVAAVAAVLAVVAGAAFGLPGSPLRAWWEGLVEGPGREAHTPRRTVVPPPAEESVGEPGAGVAVDPGRAIVVRFAAAQESGSLEVRRVDEALLLVEGPPGAARYVSGPGTLDVDNTGARGSFTVRVPRAARRVEIRVAGRRVFLQDGSRVVVAGSAPAGDRHVLPLAP